MTDVIFVSDVFVEDYIGGAELTSEAIISKSPFTVHKVRSMNVDTEFIKNNIDKTWIIGNFALMSDKTIFELIKLNIKYDIVEYDFKYCGYRSPQKHAFYFGECDCHKQMRGKIISLFFKNARRCWFMSEEQMNVYLDKFSFLKTPNMHVLSSVFKKSVLDKILNIKNKKDEVYLILNSDSWLKATKNCVEYAKKNGLKYELVSGISHNDMLNKLSNSKGLIFMPLAHDTCPRITIEAKLLDCELILNDNVLHKDEEWFSGSKEKTIEYLKNNCDALWSSFNE